MDEKGIKKLIREVLAEELRAARQSQAGAFAATAPLPQVCEEVVSIGSDHELMTFVHHLLELVKDNRVRTEIESRRRVFRLAGRSAGASGALASDAPDSPAMRGNGVPPARFDRGLVTERSVNAMVVGTTRLILGKRARLTPLARDRVRQRGIKIERFSR